MASDSDLSALAAALKERRPHILEAWRGAVHGDSRLGNSSGLPRVQLDDHIPQMLACFEDGLRGLDAAAAPAPVPPARGDTDAAAHGLHRWQQGYNLREVTRELGLLNQVMVTELDRHAAVCAPQALALARAHWSQLHTRDVEESVDQYDQLQQVESEGHVADLQQALHQLGEVERERAARWQEIAHDLRGNVGVVTSAAHGMRLKQSVAESSERFLFMLERNLGSLRDLLDDVTQLARLQAGHEERCLAEVDVGELLGGLCEGLQAKAHERALYLRCDGPAQLRVWTDAPKLRRVAQNLLINALKYTVEGGVQVRWEAPTPQDALRWRLIVQDTGPGFQQGPAAPVTAALEEATLLADEVAQSAADGAPPAAAPQRPAKAPPAPQQSGEGIGLSIVKRLAEMLDATVEVVSEAGRGTEFALRLPVRYELG